LENNAFKKSAMDELRMRLIGSHPFVVAFKKRHILKFDYVLNGITYRE
jgi:hypothetical protein